MKIENAISRLNKILPLKRHLDALPAETAQLYRAVLDGFYSIGRAPTLDELIRMNAAAAQELQTLAQQDLLMLDDMGEVFGCYPFTMDKRIHRIVLNGHQVHAMCALDALAPSAMFECASEVFSECAVTQAAVHIRLLNQAVENADKVEQLHFGINWQAASSCCSCADSLCTEMLFLIDRKTAQNWQQQDEQNREIFTLPQAVAFSAGFFKPLMEEGANSPS